MLGAELLPTQTARFVLGNQPIDLRTASPTSHPSQLLFAHATTSASACLREQMGCSNACEGAIFRPINRHGHISGASHRSRHSEDYRATGAESRFASRFLLWSFPSRRICDNRGDQR